MNILITGGTGFLGRHLAKQLLEQGHRITILSRSREKVRKTFGETVKALTDLSQISANETLDVAINLAGAPIFEKRWTPKRKKIIFDSRIGLTQQLIETIARMERKPRLLISGSAVGFYGNQGDTVLTERTPGNPDFSQQLCAEWEGAALQAEQYGVRVCLIRTGLVLDSAGGILQRMLPAFRLGFGGRLGDGKQWMSWIHIHDWLNIVDKMMTDERMHGAFNATAPNPVTNRQFTELLAETLKKPACFHMPAFSIKLLFGEMSELLLGSQRVRPERLLSNHFVFKYPELRSALTAILANDS